MTDRNNVIESPGSPGQDGPPILTKQDVDRMLEIYDEVKACMDHATAEREEMLASALDEQGYLLWKSDAEDSRDPTFGLYWIADAYLNAVTVWGPYPNGMLDLDDVEAWVNTPDGEEVQWPNLRPEVEA